MAGVDPAQVRVDVEALAGAAIDAIGPLGLGRPLHAWERDLLLANFYLRAAQAEWVRLSVDNAGATTAQIDPVFMRGFIARALRLLGQGRPELVAS